MGQGNGYPDQGRTSESEHAPNMAWRVGLEGPLLVFLLKLKYFAPSVTST